MKRIGSTHHPSIINGVLGPVTLGPSSSHLAGPLRLGRLARSILGEEPGQIDIAFNEGGSLAGTYRGHRTDCALVAGALGWDTDDERIPRALDEARRQGVQVRVEVQPLDSDHPNTIRMRLLGTNEARTEVMGTSEGGGAVLLSRVEGRETALDGGHYAVLVWKRDEESPIPLDAVPGAQVLSNGGPLTTVRVPAPLSPEQWRTLEQHPGIHRVQQVEPVVRPPGDGANEEPLFASAAEILDLAESRNLRLSELGLQYETGRQGWSEQEVRAEVRKMLDVMRDSLDRGRSEELQFGGGIVKQGGTRLLEAISRGETLGGGVMARAAAYAMAINEVNAALGLIVAAPTAGGCGVLPGALLATAEEMDITEETDRLVDALLTAGAVGAVFAKRVTFLAELCGCQVESGAGSAMAAAALVELRGGTVAQSLDAASVTLQNILGMECDPVAGLMEVPCITRNALGAVNAILCTDIVLAGVPSVIPLDEVLDAVYETGRLRPVQCSGTGGLAVTPTSRRLAEKFLQDTDWS